MKGDKLNKIENIKNCLNNIDTLHIIAQSMYMPTEDKINALVNKYLKNQDIIVYGYTVENQVQGIIVLEVTDINNIVILNIAVDRIMQFKGIGRNLIEYSIRTFKPETLIAETDDDAIDFYKKCGFEIMSIGKKYGNSNRYECKYITQW